MNFTAFRDNGMVVFDAVCSCDGAEHGELEDCGDNGGISSTFGGEEAPVAVDISEEDDLCRLRFHKLRLALLGVILDCTNRTCFGHNYLSFM